jgi:hypothetical protein
MPIKPDHPIFQEIADAYEQHRDLKLVSMEPDLYEALAQIGRNCHAIIKGIESEGLTSLKYSDLPRLTGSEELVQTDIAAASFMAGCKDHILSPRFEFIVDGEVLDLTDDQRAHVIGGKGPIPHPLTGEVIEDPQAHAYLGFDVVEGIFDWQPETDCSAEEVPDAY